MEHHDRIDGLLIDLTMPRMDGFEVLRQIRARDPAMPILLMSGYSRSDTAIRAAGRGAGFIQKPFTQQELVAEVARLVKRPG